MPSMSLNENLVTGANDFYNKEVTNGKDCGGPMDSTFERIKQLIEKKIRNLEKRKSKLEHARLELDAGRKLTEEQIKAVECLSEVDTQVSIARDILRSLFQISDEIRQEQAIERKRYTKDVGINTINDSSGNGVAYFLQLQELLNYFNKQNVKQDFREGSSNAMQLSSEQLELLEECFQILYPRRENALDKQSWLQQTREASKFTQNLIICSNEQVPNKSVTFADLRVLLDDFANCSYFDHIPQSSRSDILVSDSGISSLSAMHSPTAPSDQPSPATANGNGSSNNVNQTNLTPPLVTGEDGAAMTVPVNVFPPAVTAIWPLTPPPMFYQPPLARGGFYTPTHLPVMAATCMSMGPLGIEATQDENYGYVFDHEPSQFFPYIDHHDLLNLQAFNSEMVTCAAPEDPTVFHENAENFTQTCPSNKALDPNAPAFVSKLFPTLNNSINDQECNMKETLLVSNDSTETHVALHQEQEFISSMQTTLPVKSTSTNPDTTIDLADTTTIEIEAKDEAAIQFCSLQIKNQCKAENLTKLMETRATKSLPQNALQSNNNDSVIVSKKQIQK